MNARDNAYRALRELYVSHQGVSAPWDKGCATCGARMEKVMAVVDAFAHELAERVRADRDITIPVHTAWSRGMSRAADLIDPTMEDDRG